MKRWLGLSLVVLAGCKAHHVPQALPAAQVRSTSMEYRSGLRVVFEARPGSQRVAMSFLVGAGSSNDPRGREGVAHFVEHLAFRSRPANRLSMWDELDFAGVASADSSHPGASTFFDATTYSGITPADRIGAVLPLMAALVTQPLKGVTDDVLAVERSVIRNEHLERNAHGGGDIIAAVMKAIQGENGAWSRPISGGPASIEAITRDDLERFVTQGYTPNNTVLVMVGDLDAAAIDGLIRRSFPPTWLDGAPLGARSIPTVVRSPVPPPPSEVPAIIEANVKTKQLVLGWTLPGEHTPGSLAFPLLAERLEGSLSSLEGKEGVQSVSAALIPGSTSSSLVLTVALAPRTAPNLVLPVLKGQAFPKGLGPGVWRRFAIGRLADEQSLLDRADARARGVFETNSLKPVRLNLDGATLEAALTLGEQYLTWDKARVVEVVPLAARRFDDAKVPERSDTRGRLVTVQKEMIEQVALPPPLPEVHRFTLENGLQVVMVRRTPVPVVSVSLALPEGSRTTERSVQSLLNAVLNWKLDTQDMKGLGAPDVHMTPDETLLRVRGHSSDLPVMLDVLGHNLNPRVTWGALSFLEQFVEIAEDFVAKDPLERSRTSEQRARVMPPHSMLVPVELAEMRALPERTFVEFIERAFRPNGAVLIIDGDVDFAAAEPVVRELFADWKPVTPKNVTPRALGTAPERVVAPKVVERSDGTATEVMLTCRVAAAATVEQRGALEVLADALEQTFEDELRRSRGLTYGVSASHSDFRSEDNVLELVVQLDPRDRQRGLTTFFETLDSLDGALWSEEQIGPARWRVAKSFLGTWTTSQQISALLGIELAHGGSWDGLNQLAAKMANAPLAAVDDAWVSCTDTMVLRIEGNQASIDGVLKARAKK